MTSNIPTSSQGLITDKKGHGFSEEKTSGIRTSERIRQRLLNRNASFFANDNLAECIESGELIELEKEGIKVTKK